MGERFRPDDAVVTASIHFELLSPLENLAEADFIGMNAKGKNQPYEISEPKSLSFKYLENQLSSQVNYLTLFTLGLAEYSEGDWSQALVRFDAASKAADEVEEQEALDIFYLYEGNSFAYLEDYEEAITAYSKALSINQNLSDAFLNRGVMLAYVADDDATYNEALADFNASIQNNRDDAVGYTNKGLVLNELERPDDAIDAFDKALAISDENEYALYGKGVSLNRMNDAASYREAVAVLDKALSINAENRYVLIEKGDALSALEKYSEAVSTYEEALKLDAKDYITYVKKGNALNELGRTDEAIEAYNSSLEADPDYFPAAARKVLTLLDEEAYEQVLVAIDVALEIRPDNYDLYLYKGEALAVLGRDDEAALSCQSAIETIPFEYYLDIVKCYASARKPEQALNSLEKYIEDFPNTDKSFLDSSMFDSLRSNPRFMELSKNKT